MDGCYKRRNKNRRSNNVYLFVEYSVCILSAGSAVRKLCSSFCCYTYYSHRYTRCFCIHRFFRYRKQYLCADWVDHARRTIGQERHPDCRICSAKKKGWHVINNIGTTSCGTPASSNSYDILRIHYGITSITMGKRWFCPG